MEFHFYLIGSLCVIATILGATVAHTDRGSKGRTLAVSALWIIGFVLAVDFAIVWARGRDFPKSAQEKERSEPALATATPSSTPTAIATATPTLEPTKTPTPTPTPSPTPAPTPAETPVPTQTPAPTPNPTPTAPPKAPPQPLDGAEKSQFKKAPSFKLGPIVADVGGVKNARSDLQVYVTIKNQSNTAVYVFAGSSDPIGASWRQTPRGFQALTGHGSDNKNSTFWLESVEGFTRAADKYFSGENIYIELAPNESANVSFLLANNWLTGPELGNTVNVSIEFAIVTDLRSKGSHQTRALTLTNWPLQ